VIRKNEKKVREMTGERMERTGRMGRNTFDRSLKTMDVTVVASSLVRLMLSHQGN